jgi:ATP-dependent 26S proteasome regulatory subunit
MRFVVLSIGTGKTLLARASAAAAGAHWHAINAPELVGSYVGDSEAKV